MKKQIVGMVLAGGRVDELSVLTAKRPKSALPIWGMYRIIDFVLSNMMHAGIEVVGVLSQYRPYSLMTHLGDGAAWDYVGRSRLLRILSPFKGSTEADWYKGTADALHQNMNFVSRFSPELVLVAAGDHVYSMDYRPMIRQHLATGADLTMALKKVPREDAHLYGTAVVDEDARVVRYQEKAKNPESDLASLTIYVFNTDVLARRLEENAAEGRSHHIYADLIPRMVKEKANVRAYVFDGYWRYARTLDSYYAANMEMISDEAPDPGRWNVRTNPEVDSLGDPTPALFARTAEVRSSLVSCHTQIEGTVERSVLSPGTVVERGAVVRDSVLMHGCRICEGAVVDRVVLDKGVRVGKGAFIGNGEPVPNAIYPATLSSGVTVVGKDTPVPAGKVIGRGCIVHQDLEESDFPRGGIESGTTVIP